MRPTTEKLRAEGIAIESYEVWHSDENSKKMDEYDKGYCGGVPFFVNPETGKWICGECSYEELKALAS